MLARKDKLDPGTLFSSPHRTARGEYLSVQHAPAAGRTGTFAVVVSAKVARTSVLRHRVKRALFAEVRRMLPLPFSAAVSVKKIPAGGEMKLLRNDLAQLFTAINSSIVPRNRFK